MQYSICEAAQTGLNKRPEERRRVKPAKSSLPPEPAFPGAIGPELRKLGDYSEIAAAFRWKIPARYNVARQLCDRHAGDETRVALFFEAEDGFRASYSFAQLKTLSDRLANALKGIGIGRADRVGILLPQRPETAVIHLAALKLGAIVVPMAPLFGIEAVAHRMNDSGARVLFFSHSDREKILDERQRLPSIERFVTVGGGGRGADDFEALLTGGRLQLEPADTAADDPAFLVYTSGTTGLPKGALHAHRAIPGRLTGLEMAHNFLPRPGDLFWSPADWAWMGGLMDSLLAPWVYGLPVLAVERKGFDPERAFALMRDYRVRNAFLPPTALKMMSAVPDALRRYGSTLRSVHSGGEALPAPVLEWGKRTLGSVAEIYGMTEVGFVAGYCPDLVPLRPGSLGRAYPGHRVEVIGDDGDPLPPGTPGEVGIHRDDPGMFLGYWQNPEASREKFAGEWLRSGDLAVKDEAGYFWYRGRKDDVIISAGYRIGPTEIEECIFRHPAVADVAVVGAPDPIRGSVVKAFVVAKPGFAPGESLKEEIQLLVKTRLAAHEYPRQVEFVADLPRTVTGKIQRHLLRAREAG